MVVPTRLARYAASGVCGHLSLCLLSCVLSPNQQRLNDRLIALSTLSYAYYINKRQFRVVIESFFSRTLSIGVFTPYQGDLKLSRDEPADGISDFASCVIEFFQYCLASNNKSGKNLHQNKKLVFR